MSGSEIGFRWLDILEKEFDRACVELDPLILDTEDEPTIREHLSTMTACFSQLSHKALTVFQNAAKLEAELIDYRSSLAEVRASQQNETSEASHRSNPSETSAASVEASIFARENQALRQTVLTQHSELCAARLAARYLEKELAGRIQQLQLLGRDVKQDIKERLWTQLEAEITLQRQKTLIKRAQNSSEFDKLFSCSDLEDPNCVVPSPRAVRVRRQPHQGLGIAITGGAEHGVPIIISSIEDGGPAWQTRALHAGDAILSVDDVDLRCVPHAEAAGALANSRHDCTLLVTRHYVDSGWYPLMPPNQHCSGNLVYDDHNEDLEEGDSSKYVIDIFEKQNGDIASDEYDNEFKDKASIRCQSPPTPTHKANIVETNNPNSNFLKTDAVTSQNVDREGFKTKLDDTNSKSHESNKNKSDLINKVDEDANSLETKAVSNVDANNLEESKPKIKNKNSNIRKIGKVMRQTSEDFAKKDAQDIKKYYRRKSEYNTNLLTNGSSDKLQNRSQHEIPPTEFDAPNDRVRRESRDLPRVKRVSAEMTNVKRDALEIATVERDTSEVDNVSRESKEETVASEAVDGNRPASSKLCELSLENQIPRIVHAHLSNSNGDPDYGTPV